ncbi:DNA gyrase inhibitor YacG [Bermanella marisrubri]|uniref:DNA gyrase inhibitor YacG n=1 Tax=Bermanella marisrubri TaxID=207949 RepID=Q1MZP5_9GAMM|nr:DNA gyrase inhibitor YacG [Bermanella marisrubri]EAT11512.1 zinc-binding protein [Oceanobacter sp. RED65] [Bermanella marisrubri]QIZ85085.1 DNA gyrase inhibitor YacG [Bermanella marisrubri]
MKVKCPTCNKQVEWIQKEKHRPFCSERCRMIDLGAWSAEEHAIPGKSVEEEMMSEELKQINPHSLH